jgi:hypothetical protein
MATIKSEVQTANTLTSTQTSLGTLASATYLASETITHSTNDPLDVLIEVMVQTGNTPAGNKQVVIFAKGSLDGTTFGSGPESGTTTTDEPDLHYVGSIPVNTGGSTVPSPVVHRKVFSLAAAYGGVLPVATKLVFKNDLGVALTIGATVKYSEVWGVAV